MLVYFVILAFLAEGFCNDAVIEKSTRPRPCGENEVSVKCRTICQPQFCNVSYVNYVCDGVQKCEPGCDCIKNHLRDINGRCVPIEKCPPPPIQCGENQVPSDCADNYSESPQITVCQPGCRCIENYTRNSYDECVLTPPPLVCCENEEASTCKQICPSQYCDWDPTRYACKPGPCQPGCNCKKGYMRDINGKCIPQEMCPPILPQCGDNEEPTDCARNIRTYDSTLTIKCRPCQCIAGYVRDINGVCVLKEEFCKNVPNTTYTLCPNRCKSTCKNPNGICSPDCREGYGCGCKPGYLLSEQGKCILPEDCPGGNPCGKNQTLVYCNAGCPTTSCPTTNSRGIIECSQPNPCPSGCACKRNYKRQKDGSCILASECPPVECAENERWNKCPPPCFSENCGVKQTKIVCMTLIAHECQPQCVCKENYNRNSAGKCIPISQCPPQCSENEELTNCSDTYPQPLATDVASESRIRCQPECKCKAGYIKDSSGACVLKQLQCGKNEEPNFCIAIFPSNCPPCRCIASHIRNSLGLCVPAPQCGKNEEPTDCSDTYPQPQPLATDHASESRIRCQTGCKCITGYIRDRTGACVRKQLQCGKNEEPNICIAIFPSNCPPCRCIANHKRNSLGICVPAFPLTQCGKNEEPNDCSIIYPQPIQPVSEILIDVLVTEFIDINQFRIGCQPCKCIKGYERNVKGVCVPKCNGDKYAFYTECPNQCVSTCKKPNAICSQECGEPYGCKCKYGYILSEEGRCILPEECPGGNPCGRNESFVGCVFGCPTNNCQRDDSGAIAQCLPRNPCPSGCACKTNYKRVSFEDKRCVSVTDCPPFKCTRKNEEYNPCPSACFSEGCGSPQLEPKTCNTLVPNVCRPRCVCKTDFRRDISGHCIPKEKCPAVS